MSPRRRWGLGSGFVLIAALTLAAFGSRTSHDRGQRSAALEGRTMGTTWKVVVHEGKTSADLQAAVQQLLDELDLQMSHWRTDSALAGFHRTPADEFHPVPPEMAAVVEEALHWWRETQGAFDITVAPLVTLWGFGPAGPRHAAPEQSEINRGLQAVGSQYLVLDRSDSNQARLKKLRADVRLDLSALAPGFAVDQIAALLDRRGLHDYLIDVGGEMRASGHAAGGRPWRVGLEAPDANSVGVVRRVVTLTDKSLATSGNYRQFFEDQRTGRRYSHHVDPRTGSPNENGMVMVTVIADTTMRADALGTCLMVLGPEAGFQFAADRGLAAVLVFERDGRFMEKWTPAFAKEKDVVD